MDDVATAGRATAPVTCSVVIPVLNEAACLPELTDRLLKTLSQSGERYEVIFVDDGSTDAGPAFLREVTTREPAVRMIRLLGHFGQHAALAAGMERSRV